MGFGIKELVIILIIVLLLFGTKRLKTLGTDLGSAIKGFRKSVNDDDNLNNTDNTDNTDESASAENEPLLPASEKKSSEL